MKNYLNAPASNLVVTLLALVLIAALVVTGGGAPAGLAALAGESNFTTVQVDDGTAAAPSLGFTNDTDTGFYRIGSNNVGWSQGGTLGIMNGSDDFTLFDVNITNADHTGSSNTVQALDIAGITGDAQATETAINIGSGWDTALNIAGGGATIVGTFTVDAGEIGAAEIANASRNINLPLNSFIECQTDAGALIGFDTTADALPDFVNSATDGTGFVIRFDDTGSSEDQGSEICNNFTVPPDYASGGAFIVRALKDADTGATEIINCAVSVNGAALQTVGTVTTSGAASASYTCTPTISALAAADSVSFYLSITSSGTMNDVVDIASVAFQYTATQ